MTSTVQNISIIIELEQNKIMTRPNESTSNDSVSDVGYDSIYSGSYGIDSGYDSGFDDIDDIDNDDIDYLYYDIEIQ